MMTIADLLQLPSVLGHAASLDPAMTIAGLGDDSRKIQSAWLFVAKRGFHDDGQKYMFDALNRGALAIISEALLTDLPSIQVSSINSFEKEVLSAFYGGVEKQMRFVGITGTKGKTSTAFFMYDYLQKKGEAVCYIGTIGIYDRHRDFMRNHYTTPDVYSLYALVAEKVRSGHTLCIMEVSSHALVQLRINGIRFVAGGFTNLSHDHLDYHKTLEEYFAAKATLFSDHLDGYAVINCADSWGKKLYDQQPWERRIGFGPGSDVLFEWEENQLGAKIWTASFTIQTGMPGFYNAENALLAALLLRQIGFVETDYQFAMQGIPGRLERVEARGLTVYIDYAHSPDSLEKVLTLIAAKATKQLICVFGCTGDRDRTKRPVMAAIAEGLSSYTIVTSDDPHSEDPLSICREVAAGFKGSAYQIEPDRRKAIAMALEMAKRGDIVLLAGKGHEIFQVFDNYEIPFSDRLVVEELLR